MTTTHQPGSAATPDAGPQGRSVGWQPYRYGEPRPAPSPEQREPSRLVAVAPGIVALLGSLVAVLVTLVWSNRAAGLIVAATAAVLALVGVVCAVLALGRSRAGTVSGVGVPLVGTSVSAAGFAMALLWVVTLVLTSVGMPLTGSATAPPVPAAVAPVPAAVTPPVGAERRFRLEVTGTVPSATINYYFGGTTGGNPAPAALPWSKDVDGGSDRSSFGVVAFSTMGQQGSLTCAISDVTAGTVLATKTVKTDGSANSSAFTDCNFYG